MRITRSATYPVAPSLVRAAVSDPGRWTEWRTGVVELMGGTARWREPGDEVRYRCALLGHELEVTEVLDWLEAAAMRTVCTYAEGTDVVYRWVWAATPEGTEVTVSAEVPGPATWFRADAQPVPRAVDRDLKRSLQRLGSALAPAPPSASEAGDDDLPLYTG